MIKAIEIEVKGDFNGMVLKRDAGCNFVEMQFHHGSGCSYATFNFDDLKTAVELLSKTEPKGWEEG